MNGVVHFLFGLLISFLGCSLLVYRSAINFCIFFSCRLISFVLIILWWMSQGFLYTRLSHLQREIVLCLPFRSGCLVFPFLPNFLDKSFHSTLNRSGENKLPFHFLDLGEEAIQFSTINSGVSYGFSVDALYHTEKVFFCS